MSSGPPGLDRTVARSTSFKPGQPSISPGRPKGAKTVIKRESIIQEIRRKAEASDQSPAEWLLAQAQKHPVMMTRVWDLAVEKEAPEAETAPGRWVMGMDVNVIREFKELKRRNQELEDLLAATSIEVDKPMLHEGQTGGGAEGESQNPAESEGNG